MAKYRNCYESPIEAAPAPAKNHAAKVLTVYASLFMLTELWCLLASDQASHALGCVYAFVEHAGTGR